MAKPLENDVKARRALLGWSQQDLASRSGLSRTGIGAIEAGRLVPSTAAALALAAALDCRVEELFRLPRPEDEADGSAWAWAPRRDSGRYWRAEVDGQVRLFPAESSPLGLIPHDGTFRDGRPEGSGRADVPPTLVLASCDPAAGLLAAELAREAGVRLIVVGRSSRSALALLEAGAIHAAGVHLAKAGDDGNASAVREAIGPGFTLLRAARWEEGIAASPAMRLSTVRDALGFGVRWVGREAGSGARQCLDEILAGRRPPSRAASDHRGVADAIRSGWADAGICLRLTAEEAGLDFLGVREEAYDLCFPAAWSDDPRIKALVAAVRSPSYRRSLGELPGYDGSDSGGLRRVE